VRLSAADQRYTTKRQQLVQVLAAAERPLTIAEILQAAQGVPQSSAYRNLAVLTDAGVVRRVQGADENGRFELAEDLSGHHHHHLICTACGTVEDVAASPRLERALAEAGRAAADAVGFQVSEHRIDLVGRCVTCH
jgi:Fe2+ or Zn2+ uptake regulation protein